MAHKPRTGWLRFGRSGDTIDGRVISDQDIIEAAETYDTDFYTALIWPDHHRWFNMGKVVAVRAEKNSEGGMDLFGQIEANEIYRAINSAGQRLFTSMELFPKFRNTEKTYLSGLGATDIPASVATSEVHLSRVEDKAILVATYSEATTHDFNEQQDDDQPPGWFTRFFSKQTKSDEGDMKQETAEQLLSSINTLTEAVQAFTKQPKAEEADTTAGDSTAETELTPEKFAALEKQVTELKAKIESKDSGKTESDTATITADQFNTLQNNFNELAKQFKAALGEQDGTDAGDHTGESFKDSDYM